MCRFLGAQRSDSTVHAHEQARLPHTVGTERWSFYLSKSGSILLSGNDLSLHGRNRFLLFGHLQLERFLSLQFGFVPHGDKRLLDPSLDGQIHLTFGVVEFPSLADEFP